MTAKQDKSESMKELFLQDMKAVASPKRSTPSIVSLDDESDLEGMNLKATLSIESLHHIEGRLLNWKNNVKEKSRMNFLMREELKRDRIKVRQNQIDENRKENFEKIKEDEALKNEKQ